LLLAGCAVTPVALTPQEQSTQAQGDLATILKGVEPVQAPITLSDATARAIRNNLAFRVKQMEVAVQANQLDLSQFDMLPRLALSAGYTWRNNDAFGLGFQPDGTISSVPSAATERIRHTANAALTWNLLDFGVSYYRARQNAELVLVAEERRRRALQNLVLDVQLAWWRAEAAQRLLPQVDEMLAQIDRGAERSRLIEARRLLPPLQVIAYRRSLMDLQQQLSQRRQDLAQWRTELAEIMGLRPGETYRVAGAPTGRVELPGLITRVDDLEALAIERRPELGEERYRQRVTVHEGKKQILSLLPSLNVNAGPNYDSNKYLIHNSWMEAGGLISFNLLKLLSLPALRRTQAATEELDTARRLAATMSVMAQTRIAVNRYELLKHELGVWNEALADDRALLRAMKSSQQAGLETELETIRAAARLAITEVNRGIVHANLEYAMGRVMNSVGYDVVTPETRMDQTPTLATQLQAALGAFAADHFSVVAQPPMESVQVGRVIGLPDAAVADFLEAMQTVLRVARIPTADSGAAIRTEVRVRVGAPQQSGRPVTMRVALLDGTRDKILHTAEMSTMLVEPVSAEQWKVLGEAAVFRVADRLRGLLGGGLQAANRADTLSLTEGDMLKIDRRWTGPLPVSAHPDM
jgi:outer membrane protein TolC